MHLSRYEPSKNHTSKSSHMVRAQTQIDLTLESYFSPRLGVSVGGVMLDGFEVLF